MTTDPLARLRAGRTTCARCGAGFSSVLEALPCWWCRALLCPGCYREPGHCDHPEAVEVLGRLRERERLLRLVVDWTLERVALVTGLGPETIRRLARRFGLGRLERGSPWRFTPQEAEGLRELYLCELAARAARSKHPSWPEWARIALAAQQGKKP